MECNMVQKLETECRQIQTNKKGAYPNNEGN